MTRGNRCDFAAPEGKYSVGEICDNCHQRAIFSIPKGITRQDYLANKECPMCGCLGFGTQEDNNGA